jgi:hypothetical protein
MVPDVAELMANPPWIKPYSFGNLAIGHGAHLTCAGFEVFKDFFRFRWCCHAALSSFNRLAHYGKPRIGHLDVNQLSPRFWLKLV